MRTAWPETNTGSQTRLDVLNLGSAGFGEGRIKGRDLYGPREKTPKEKFRNALKLDPYLR